jgi:hypothetical protein
MWPKIQPLKNSKNSNFELKFFKPKFVQNLSVIYQLIREYLQLLQVQLLLNLFYLRPLLKTFRNKSCKHPILSTRTHIRIHCGNFLLSQTFLSPNLPTSTDSKLLQNTTYFTNYTIKRFIAGMDFLNIVASKALYLDANKLMKQYNDRKETKKYRSFHT